MEVIVLAGGFGTRLNSEIKGIPKPMAPIGNKPFIEYLAKYLYYQKASKIIFSVGYLHEKIIEYFGYSYNKIPIEYSIENEPLGTGGAIKKALGLVTEHNVVVINGDTFFNIDINKLLEMHNKFHSDLTLALKPMKNFNRYGNVVSEGNRIIKFEEKRQTEAGYINGGIYVLNSELLNVDKLSNMFSFEKDFMEKYVDNFSFYACIFDKYFIDIGIPEDYEKAKKELPLMNE